jgi:hypothetical protein
MRDRESHAEMVLQYNDDPAIIGDDERTWFVIPRFECIICGCGTATHIEIAYPETVERLPCPRCEHETDAPHRLYLTQDENGVWYEPDDDGHTDDEPDDV